MDSASKKKSSLLETDFEWKTVDGLIYGSNDKNQASKLDDTIIEVKSKSKFPKDADDWKFLYDKKIIQTKMQEYSSKKYKIVIFTNQKGISTGSTNPENIKTKIQNISKELGIPLTVYIASQDNQFRKPKLGMWDHFKANSNGGVDVDIQKSIYVGDAAGRKTATHKDFSDSDLKFAKNIGVTFKLPEEFFLDQKSSVKLEVKGFNPKEYKFSKTIFKDGSNNYSPKKNHSPR